MTSALRSGPASPFASVLTDWTAVLPPPLRDQYLVTPDSGFGVWFAGDLDRVWRRHAWLWPVFRILAATDILFPETGKQIACRMVVRAERRPDGRAVQIWRQTFEFPHRRRRIQATIAYDEYRDRLVEWFGPGGIVQIVWRVSFAPPGNITFAMEYNEFALKWGAAAPAGLAWRPSAGDRMRPRRPAGRDHGRPGSLAPLAGRHFRLRGRLPDEAHGHRYGG